MNPILHELESKQWVWTAKSTAQTQQASTGLNTGFDELDNALSGGFPASGMVHISSQLGCGELRLMLSVLKQQRDNNNRNKTREKSHADSKLWVFIAPPFMLNAEFFLSENIDLSRLIVINPETPEEALWSAEQCAKSGACASVFLWQQSLQHTQIRKLELASLHGQCQCFWFDNSQRALQNLPLSLSLSLKREDEQLHIKINKQKIGWAKPAVKVKVPFKCRTRAHFKNPQKPFGKVVSIQSHSAIHSPVYSPKHPSS
ncbi:translesion DNA synthesis-associated protein ImuA [Ningiella sp. W23]|uniref:translesion DNA synthesis-associated protein ImuA n=1 Tax=Ningiella sp. W23 TaxID=3023715 RepID=UPI003756F1F4